MARVLSPVLSFTAEEVYRNLPKSSETEDSVFLSGFPKPDPSWEDKGLMERWSALRNVRRQVTKTLEGLRTDGVIGNSLDASVQVEASGATWELLSKFDMETLADLFLVSEISLAKGSGEPAITAQKSVQSKCPRCWRRGHGIGSHDNLSELCSRCAELVQQMIANGDIEIDLAPVKDSQ
jgi:isoleucyl-tRNA synthetase